jgi:hypothetical protein
MKAKPDEPMNCDRFEASVLEELYGELPAIASAQVGRHAAECERCGALLRGLRATRVLASPPLDEPPAGLEERAIDALVRGGSGIGVARRSGPTRLRTRSATYVVAMAAGFVLIAGGAGLWLRRQEAPIAAATVHGQVPVAGPVAALPSAASEPVEVAAAEPPSEQPGESSQAPRSAASPRSQPHPQVKPSLVTVPKEATELALGGRTFAASPPRAAPATAAEAASPAVRARVAGPAPAVAALDEASASKSESASGRVEAPSRPTEPDVLSELGTARHVRDAQGCAAALPLFERIVERVPGSASGYAAMFDSAICHEAISDYSGALARLDILSRVDAFRDRAIKEIARLGARPQR